MALNELAGIWLDADSGTQPLITEAAKQIDAELELNPYAAGESRSAGLRILLCFPLGVIFQVEQDERTVSVLHAWRFGRRTL